MAQQLVVKIDSENELRKITVTDVKELHGRLTAYNRKQRSPIFQVTESNTGL